MRKRRVIGVKTPPRGPKLSVYVDPPMMRRVRLEKANTGRSMEDIVNTRLQLSYRDHPAPLREELQGVSA